jgi:hypothetical protein
VMRSNTPLRQTQLDWSFLMTEFLLVPEQERPAVALEGSVLKEGNYLAVALH